MSEDISVRLKPIVQPSYNEEQSNKPVMDKPDTMEQPMVPDQKHMFSQSDVLPVSRKKLTLIKFANEMPNEVLEMAIADTETRADKDFIFSLAKNASALTLFRIFYNKNSTSDVKDTIASLVNKQLIRLRNSAEKYHIVAKLLFEHANSDNNYVELTKSLFPIFELPEKYRLYMECKTQSNASNYFLFDSLLSSFGAQLQLTPEEIKEFEENILFSLLCLNQKFKSEISAFREDKSLIYYFDVFKILEQEMLDKEKPIIAFEAAKISRNIFFKKGANIKVDSNVVSEVQRETEVLLSKYGDIIPGKKGKIIALANNEVWGLEDSLFYSRGEKERFIPPLAREGFLALNQNSIFYKAQGSISSQTVKDNVLKEVASTKGELFFVFDGHGEEAGLSISKNQTILGQKMQAESIASGELAEAFFRKMQHDPQSQNIIALSSCYNNNFVRSFYDILQFKLRKAGLKAKLPITIIGAEYGQKVYNNNVSYGTNLMEFIIKGNPIKGLVNIKQSLDAINNGDVPIVFIPDENGVPTQVVNDHNGILQLVDSSVGKDSQSQIT